MVFKLVRIDTQDPAKIQLSVGTHVIGRGKFLHNDDADKRVSRNHAELEVTSDTVMLKSLHQNPCFYIKKSTVDTELLQQNCSISLCHGDKFGLLPDHFWYEVLHCTDIDSTESAANETTQGAVNETTENGIENGQEQRMEMENGQEQRMEMENDQKNKLEEEKIREQDNVPETNDIEEREHIAERNVEENKEVNRLEENEQETNRNGSNSPSLFSTNTESTQEYDVKPQVPLDNDTRSPVKRSPSSRDSSPLDVKRVKTEPIDAPDATAGTSGGQPTSNADSKDNIAVPTPASPVKPNSPSRERCIYGANCYRRNPAHKAQFSHPSDADWGSGERGACPYGRACRRRDPRHWAQHEHPPGAQAPDPHAHRPGNRTNRRPQRRMSDSDEDCPNNDLVVTGKRARRPLPRQDWSESESESDKDPYETDDSDDWQPPSDVTNSQDFLQD